MDEMITDAAKWDNLLAINSLSADVIRIYSWAVCASGSRSTSLLAADPDGVMWPLGSQPLSEVHVAK